MLKSIILSKILVILMCFVLLFSNLAFALTDPGGSGGAAVPPASTTDPEDSTDPAGSTSDDMGAQYQAESQKFQNGEGAYGTIKQIADIMFEIALAVAIFKLIQIGIGFLTGSGKSRQDAKAALIPWVIGVAVCALYLTVGNWIINTLTSGLSNNIFG